MRFGVAVKRGGSPSPERPAPVEGLKGALGVDAKYNDDGTVSITLSEEDLKRLVSGGSSEVLAQLTPNEEMTELSKEIASQSTECERSLGEIKEAVKIAKGMEGRVRDRTDEIKEEVNRAFRQHEEVVPPSLAV